MKGELKEGFKVFHALCVTSRGYEAAANLLEEQINEATKEYDITLGSGGFKDDASERNVYFAYQMAMLKKKK